MKNLSLLFIAFLLLQLTSLAQQGWFQQESGTNAQLNSVFFLDSLNGWVVSTDSTILRTTNGGDNWNSFASGYNINYGYNDVFFISDAVGWVVGSIFQGIILFTSDGGQTWEKQSDDITLGLYSITFITDSLGFIAGGFPSPGGGIILKTEDRGINWDTSYIYTVYPSTDIFYDIDFVNPDVGWAVGGVEHSFGSIVMKTADGGENWKIQLNGYMGYRDPFSSCEFISENEGWVIVNQDFFSLQDAYSILYTQDGGENWQIQKLPDTLSNYTLQSIFFINERKGWCAGAKWDDINPNPNIFHTTNAGKIWIEQSTPIQQYSVFNSIYFINEYVGWAVGDSGIILKTTDGGVSFVEEEEIDEIPTDYSITQNYPNPFNNSTVIKYSIPQEGLVTLKIFNVIGEEIAELVNETKQIGNYEVSFNATSLPSGVYFYRLQAGSFVETKKMLLIK